MEIVGSGSVETAVYTLAVRDTTPSVGVSVVISAWTVPASGGSFGTHSQILNMIVDKFTRARCFILVDSLAFTKCSNLVPTELYNMENSNKNIFN